MNHKKMIGFRFFVCVLVLAMTLTMFASCSKNSGKTLMSLESTTISVNVYQLLLTRMKGALARSFGSQVMTDSFWQTTIESDGTTYNDYFTAEVLQNTKTYLVALYLFDEYGLELSEEAVAAVDKDMEGLLVGDGDGSKSQLNQILSAYGMNYNMLREFYLAEKKVTALQNYLYGANASLVASGVKNEFMRENYVCFRQIFLASYYYVKEVDAYGNVAYFSSDGTKYLYDTENGVTMEDKNGKVIVDKYGNEIYFDADGKVLYDTKKGKTLYVTDENGAYTTKDYTKEELEKIEKNAELLASQVTAGDFEDFEELMEEYSEDEEGMEEYENGYFLAKDTTYSYTYLNDICAALSDMEVGESEMVTSDYGYHIIMKYECEDGAYAEEANSIWFTDFNSMLIEMLFLQEANKYMDGIKLDEDLLGTLDMKSVTHNYYY